MASEVIMPRVDMDMAEGKIAFWYVKNGDTVAKGQPLFDIETDKATMEVEAHTDGIVTGIQGDIGVMMPVGTVVAWLLAEGESLPSAMTPSDTAGPELAAVAEPPSFTDAVQTHDVQDRNVTVAAHAIPATRALLRATPLARSVARKLNIDLSTVEGSGPAGRVLVGDLPRADIAATPPERTPLHAQWLQEGTGAPLVMLHGFGADHGSWKAFAGHLQGHPALAIDLPNHGKSPAGPTLSVADVATHVLQTLDMRGIEDFHLLGHSLGGAIALALFAQASRRVRSITLLAPAGLGPDINGAFLDGLCRAETEASLRPWLTELVNDTDLISSSFLATAHKQLAPVARREALRGVARSLMPQGTQAESWRYVLSEVGVPAKVIWGSDDRIIPSHHGLNLPGRVGLHVLRGVGHLPYVEAPELVASLVAEQVRH